VPRLKKEYSYTSTPPVGLCGLFCGELKYGSEKENWRILINKETYSIVKKPTVTETVRLHRLCWFGHVQRMEVNRIPNRVLYTDLETKD
jgi:hypothetical protein